MSTLIERLRALAEWYGDTTTCRFPAQFREGKERISRDLAEAATRIEQDAKRIEALSELLRLFPEAYDVLTRQEMQNAKGNWRSLIDQQSSALKKARAIAILQEPDNG